MATIHISEADAVRGFAGLLAHVRLDAEIVIENGAYPPAGLRVAAPPRRSIEECIAQLRSLAVHSDSISTTPRTPVT
ncbi:MAG: hypothetical protein ABR924_12175 [Terracidiphilus sp.]|jgi:hypothetical protein